jgi:hypothetical protein
MPCANHLREINQHGLPILSPNQDIKLVEIAMDQSRMRETNDQSHELGVQLPWAVHDGDLAPEVVSMSAEGRVADLHGVRIDQGHDDAVSGLVDGDGNGESILVENLEVSMALDRLWDQLRKGRRLGEETDTHLHKGKLLLGGQSRHVHPRRRFPLAQIIPLGLDSPEGYSPESAQRQHSSSSISIELWRPLMRSVHPIPNPPDSARRPLAVSVSVHTPARRLGL